MMRHAVMVNQTRLNTPKQILFYKKKTKTNTTSKLKLLDVSVGLFLSSFICTRKRCVRVCLNTQTYQNVHGKYQCGVLYSADHIKTFKKK